MAIDKIINNLEILIKAAEPVVVVVVVVEVVGTGQKSWFLSNKVPIQFLQVTEVDGSRLVGSWEK